MPKQGEVGGRLVNDELELVFAWDTDRFVHTIHGGESQLAAVERSDFDTPVFQEVHQQGDVLFLSGMSGGRHWSASVEPAADGFAFDIACRVKQADLPAASLYEGAGLRIEPQGDGDGRPEVDGLTVLAAAEHAEPPYTIRYRYRINRPT